MIESFLSSRSLRLMAFALGFVLVLWLAGGRQAPDGASPSTQASQAGESTGQQMFACPMGDIPPVPQGGKCPICGMELIALPDDALAGPAGARLRLSPRAMALAEIVTAPAERRSVVREVPVFGKIEYDPSYFFQLDAFSSGVIDKIYVRRAGEFVRSGQRLFDYWSEEVYAAELELIELAKVLPAVQEQLGGPLSRAQPETYAEGAEMQGLSTQQKLVGGRGRPGASTQRLARQTPPALVMPPAPKETGKIDLSREPRSHNEPFTPPKIADEVKAREEFRRFTALRYKLRSLGMSDLEMSQTIETGQPTGLVPVRLTGLAGPVGGIVLENNLVQGRYVLPGAPLLVVADTRFVWASFEAFESDFPWVRFGQEIAFTVEGAPGDAFTGRVMQITPNIDPGRRTFGFGVVYTDQQSRLRPGMSVRGKLKVNLTRDGKITRDNAPDADPPLAVPASAPLVTGERAIVWVAVADSAPDGKQGQESVFEAREVVLGPRGGDWQVVVKGLQEGERVVVNGAFKLDSEAQILGRPSLLNRPKAEDASKKQVYGGIDPVTGRAAVDPRFAAPGEGFQAPAPRADEKPAGQPPAPAPAPQTPPAATPPADTAPQPSLPQPPKELREASPGADLPSPSTGVQTAPKNRPEPNAREGRAIRPPKPGETILEPMPDVYDTPADIEFRKRLEEIRRQEALQPEMTPPPAATPAPAPSQPEDEEDDFPEQTLPPIKKPDSGNEATGS